MKNRLIQRLKTVNNKRPNNIWGSVNKLFAIFVNLPKRIKKKLVKDKIGPNIKLKCTIPLEIKVLEKEEWVNKCLFQNPMLIHRWQSHPCPIPCKVPYSIIIHGKVTLVQTATLSEIINLVKEVLFNSKDKELTVKDFHLLV